MEIDHPNCGHSAGRPTSITEDLLSEIRDSYIAPKGDWAESRIERVMRAAGIQSGEKVLDLGCAWGTFCFHSTQAGALGIGLDWSETTLRIGREVTLRVAGVLVPRVCGDAGKLPFRDEAFDVVINADFIEHVGDDSKTAIFAEMFRVLGPRGRALIYTPNLNRVQWELRGERLKRSLGLRKRPVPAWRDFVDKDHFGLTTPGRTVRALRQAGFQTSDEYFEFHVPLLSKLKGFDRLAAPLLSPQFANRFLIRATKLPFIQFDHSERNRQKN